MTGQLKVNAVTALDNLPIANAKIKIIDKAGELLYSGYTDANGVSPIYDIEAPDVELTLDQNYNHAACSFVDCEVRAEGYNTVIVNDVEIVSTSTATLKVEMHPMEATADIPNIEIINIPPIGLLLPVDQQQTTEPYYSIRQVQIPDYITVHLGVPQDTTARNVKVSFIDYIANVASSEIYPTWPYNSLVANIHCIVTFAINRVYTEWYRSRGFPFDITNSTSYDQYFVYGRNIFDNIYEIANNVFNVYARRFAFRNPFFTEYCNGTTVTCRGLSQWGTVDLANRGYTPLQILHYYYPNDLELIGTDNIAGIQQTYPGYSLKLGSTGAYVQKMQVYLNRIRVNYPLIPVIPNPNGVFDASTDAAVRTFQRVFNLTADGIIGKTTWNSISFKYFGVIKLAELESEGERIGIGKTPPNVVIQQGSRGVNVVELQFIINYISAFYESIPTVIQNGDFNAATKNAVIQFQKTFNLTVDGIVGPRTWAKLYSVYNGIANNTVIPPSPPPPGGTNPPYPSTPLRLGSSGSNVMIMQTYLNTIRTVYNSINPLLIVDGNFGVNTRNAVISFQQQFLLVPDGIIGPITWNKIVEMFNRVTGGVS